MPADVEKVIGQRRWSHIRAASLASYPDPAPKPGAKPEPGIDSLEPLRAVMREGLDETTDLPSVRSNLLGDAVYLFHKCAHCHLAAHRLGQMGMHSWAMFNAYHAAYIGARGIMALLGIGLPTSPIHGGFLVDVFPPPTNKKDLRLFVLAEEWEFTGVRVVHFSEQFQQRALWQAFLRVLRVSKVPEWTGGIFDSVKKLSHEGISKERNHILYRNGYWPEPDLVTDAAADRFVALAIGKLKPQDDGFLLRLSCSVYRLFEELVSDLAQESGPIREQIEVSRVMREPDAVALGAYNSFVAHMVG